MLPPTTPAEIHRKYRRHANMSDRHPRIDRLDMQTGERHDLLEKIELSSLTFVLLLL